MDDRPTATGSAVPALRVQRYCETDAARWDAFVADSINGTFMHTRRFLSYHPADRFVDHSLLFFDEAAELCAVFPAAAAATAAGSTLKSHPGASYGGLVVQESISATLAEQLVTQLDAYARAAGFRDVWMRLPEKVFHRQWCEELDAAFFCHRYEFLGRELSCAVNLQLAGSESVPQNFASAAQRAVRKAIKSGVTAQPSDDWSAYWRILETNLRKQHGTHPTHSLEEILRLRDLFPQQVELVAATLGGQMIAGTVLFHFNSIASHTMYMAQDYEFQSYRSLNLVLATAMRVCAERGALWLNYGISSIPGTGGRELNAGLFQFKRTCGGQGVVRDILGKTL